jgi:thymidylate synthase (FAD)
MEEDMMKVELIHNTDLSVALEAMLICTDNEDKIENYNIENSLKKLVDMGHLSVLEHIYYNFVISGISRALLQELARHRHASLSVKSTRWALKKFIGKLDKVEPDLSKLKLDKDQIDLIMQLDNISDKLDELLIAAAKSGLPNDIIKYYIQESLCTKLMFTVNARELRHIFSLRLSNRALQEFQDLCKEIYKALPKEHLFIYNDILEGYGLI